MKRSPALRSLSRDHHRALSVAQSLRRATDTREAAALFDRFWEEQGKAHFRVEEEVMLPLWAALGNLDQAAAGRLAREHLEIRTRALALGVEPQLDQVHDLGQRLADHVRFEERELFGLIESDLGPADLERLAQAVAAAEARA